MVGSGGVCWSYEKGIGRAANQRIRCRSLAEAAIEEKRRRQDRSREDQKGEEDREARH